MEISDHGILRVWWFQKRNLWFCSFFLQVSLSLIFGFISSEIYTIEDNYLLLFGTWPQTLSETAPLAALVIRHHSALSEYSINRCTLMVFDGNPLWVKQNISVGFHFIYAMSIRGRWSSICLSGFVGNHLQTEHICSLSSYSIGLLIHYCFMVGSLCPCKWVCSSLFVWRHVSMCLMCPLASVNMEQHRQ